MGLDLHKRIGLLPWRQLWHQRAKEKAKHLLVELGLMDTSAAAEHLQKALQALGLDASIDPQLARTPERLAELLSSFAQGLHAPTPTLSLFELEDDQAPLEPVLICALPFQSLCVHHMLPFFGQIDVAYLPGEQITGFGSIGRVVDHFAQRPQMQERLIEQIATLLEEQLQPRGLLLRLQARQLCMEMRGAKKQGRLISFAARGELRQGPLRDQLCQEFRAHQTCAS